MEPLLCCGPARSADAAGYPSEKHALRRAVGRWRHGEGREPARRSQERETLPGGGRHPGRSHMCSTGRARASRRTAVWPKQRPGRVPVNLARRTSSRRQGSDHAPRLRSAPRGPECPEQLGPAVLRGPGLGSGSPGDPPSVIRGKEASRCTPGVLGDKREGPARSPV